MMEKVKRCIWLFAGLLVFLTCSGMLFSDRLSVLPADSQVVTERVLIPGGQSVGIQMEVRGALVVGVEQASDLQPGDMIIAVNDVPVDGPADVEAAVGDSGDPVDLTVVRDRRQYTCRVRPYFDAEQQSYKLGAWIKEKIAGIGTLTFYDPQTNRFASLGHGIYEPETGVLLAAKKGSLLHTQVNQIKAGTQGTPGELGGVIYDFQNPLGSIEKNTEFGVYGTVDDSRAFSQGTPMVLAAREEVETGDAYILTTIDGTQVEAFQIRITHVDRQSHAESRGLEFEVTDQKLLARCGGIVQGMSGSPIIQNERLVGAVTHVFVDDPQKGYGVFAEFMVAECES